MSSHLVPGTRRGLPNWLSALAVLAAGAFSGACLAADDGYLEAQQAFRGSARISDAKTLELRFDIAPGYHLYRERLAVALSGGQAQVGAPVLPPGHMEYDATFGKNVEVYRDALVVKVPVSAQSAAVRLQVDHQGCADKGLCYPPQTSAADVSAQGGAMTQVVWTPEADAQAPAVAATTTAAAITPTAPPALTVAQTPVIVTPPRAATPPAAPAAPEGGNVERALKSGSLLSIAGVFLLAGVLLSFTPCVLPMVPILSSIIVGQGAPVSRARGFSLAVAYSLGMALVYTAFGVVAGLLGEGLAAALQNPWVLGAFAALLATLSLSMFGVFELQMPGFIQNRVNATASSLPGGKHAGVFVMGGLSALIVGPCVAAPLAGALVYISQTRDVVIGGVALFCLATGMSVPLLLVGLSAGALLPRAGAWMVGVKTFFGVMLLGVALWLVSPVLPAWALMLLLGSGALLAAVHLNVFDRLPADARGLARLGKGVGVALAVLGATQLVGAASGGRDALQPLAHLARASGSAVATVGAAQAGGLAFQRIRSVAELDSALATAGRPVMLDFYADWCVACKEMEHQTFSDTRVRQRLNGALLLQADVTANSADDKALLKRFGLFGPPGVLFFNAQGTEATQARVIGYVPPERFHTSLGGVGL
ncbi:MAG: hypothetical protein RJA98_3903 [Pseudomonadota bacterium]|jgi:thiol:disulfide interchange protein DsbD